MSAFKVKNKVVDDYNNIAQQAIETSVETWRKNVCLPIYAPIEAEYRATKGYFEEANLGLGCGFPVKYAQILRGYKVLDLGCAAGIDTFIAAAVVGQEGNVYGIDLSPKLIERSRQNANLQGLSNVHFTVGDMAELPIEKEQFDVIISNGVFSLLTDKMQVFKEMYRVLKPNGHFCISDLITRTPFSDEMIPDILQLTGCFNGIYSDDFYLDCMLKSEFKNIKIVDERHVEIPDSTLNKFFSEAEKMNFKNEKQGLYAVTFWGEKS
jgi:arsenite methyltransferase